MWCFTKRIKRLCVKVQKEREESEPGDYIILYDTKKSKPDIMGLRIGKTKEGILIYNKKNYKFVPWNRIIEISMDV
jgi:hypothetical protein